LDASRTPDTPDPDRATRPAAAAAAAAALRGLMAPVREAQDKKKLRLKHEIPQEFKHYESEQLC